MEPDHSANIQTFLETYPAATLVSNAKAFGMMEQFFREDFPQGPRITVENKGTLSLGRHTLRFLFAPMVHWPEVMVTFDETDGVLFSADAFGKFGTRDTKEPWDDEARRYYYGIVGKYGRQVSVLLNAAAELPIKTICSLHGPVLTGNLSHYINLYRKWAAWEPESDGVLIAYTSVYGHTREAAMQLLQELRERCCTEVVLCDLAREDWSYAVSEAFRLGKVVLATTTYNGGMFPPMREFIDRLTERGFGHRLIGLIENGTWAPAAAGLMREMLSDAPGIEFLETSVTVRSAVSDENRRDLAKMADELMEGGACRVEPEPAPAARRWVCDICGFVFEGETLPEGYTCPVCRADASHFKPEEPAPAASAKRWVCDICGYVYEGETLPEGYTCPVCRADASHFKLQA